jgi:Telomere resolvase
MALTGRRPAEIFFLAPPSASLEKNSPIPPSSSTANSKPAKLPAPALSHIPSPSSPTQGNLSRPSTLSGPSKASRAPTPLTPPPAHNSPSTFPPPSAPSTSLGKPGHLRSAYGAICCHKFKPKNQTDDIFLAQILGHKLLGPNASLSVGQSYKDFYIR